MPDNAPESFTFFYMTSFPMKQIIQITLVTTLSVLGGCDRSPETVQAPPDAAVTVPADTVATPTSEALTASPLPATGEYEVDLSGTGAVIRANQVNELVLFKAVANRAGFQLLAEELDWKMVSVDIHAETLHAAVVELVSAYPYEIVHAPDESGQQVLSEVVIGTPGPAAANKSRDRKQAAEQRKKKKALDPGQKALLYIKEYDALGQQQAYLEKLQDQEAVIRAAAAKEIEPSATSLPVLTGMLINDPSPEVRIATTWSLENSEGEEAPQAIEALVKCLADKDFMVVAECVKSLGFIGDETTIPYLTPLLTHPDEDVRTEALEAIRFLQ